MNRDTFLELLKRNGVAGDSSRIPPSANNFYKEIPTNLIKVPEYDSFPLPKVDPRPATSPKAIEGAIVQTQYENLCLQIGKCLEEKTPVSDLEKFEEGREFDSPEEFIKFKRAMLTHYNEEAKELGYTKPIEICSEPMCVNMAIPTFKYCANHLNKDPQFETQPFIKECAGIKSDGSKCTNCAPASTERCVYHADTK